MKAAAVKCKSDQHDVAGDRTGDRDADQQRPFLSSRHVPCLDPTEGMGRIADRVEETRHLGEGSGLGVPGDGGQRAPHVEPDLGDAVNDNRQFFYQPHTRSAVDAFQIELDRRQTGRERTAIEAMECGIIELCKAPARSLCRLLGGLDPRLDVVVTIEAVLVDHLVGDPATATAELELRPLLDEPFRHG